MKRWTINYWRKPTNLNSRQRALVEAETPEDATELLRRQLNDVQPDDRLYWYQTPVEVPESSTPVGKVIQTDY
jgi:hypothetical protein